MNIQKFLKFRGTMTLKSDLHIGIGTDGDKIGGCDNPIIRNKLTGEPFIPGSSLKGAMRCIEEKKAKYRPDGTDNAGNPIDKGNPCRCGKPGCISCTMFGAHMNTNPSCGEPRLIIRDLKISTDYKKKLAESGYSIADIMDSRASTMINRRTSTASEHSLRNMEVVVAGTEFDVGIILKVTNKDKEADLVNNLKMLIKQVETVGIGSKVTSGCGDVEFNINFDKPEIINM